MMSRFDEWIDRRQTYCTQWDYVKDRFHVDGLLPFTISDMDLACPDEVQEALRKRITHPIYGYSRWKNDDYLQAICGWYKRRFDCEIDQKWICYSPSVMYAVAKMICFLSKKGEGVVIFTPAYDAFYHVIEHNERTLLACAFQQDQMDYEIDFEKLEECLKQAKILLLCNPHNPIGKVFSEAELKKIITLCEHYDVAIISDDIHMDITYGNKLTPILSLPCKVPCVICSSPSKTFNIPSLGGSYILIPDQRLWKRFETMTRYTEFVNSPAILGVIATVAAYQCDDWVEELNGYLLENLRYVDAYLKKHMPLLTMTLPMGCYFAWIHTDRLGVSDERLQEALVQEGKVAVMSGQVYGAVHRLRLNVGCPRRKIEEGLRRMQIAYDKLVK